MLQLIKTAKSPSQALSDRLSYETTASVTTDRVVLDEAAKMLSLYPYGQPWLQVEVGKKKFVELNEDLDSSFERLVEYFLTNLNPPNLSQNSDPEAVTTVAPPYAYDHQITTLKTLVSEISDLVNKPSDLDGVYAPDWVGLKGKPSHLKSQITAIMFEPASAQLHAYIKSTPHNTAEKRKAREYLNQFGHLMTEFFVQLDSLDLMTHAAVGPLSSINPLAPSAKFYLLDLDADI